jgi:hypothetical protein
MAGATDILDDLVLEHGASIDEIQGKVSPLPANCHPRVPVE